MAIKIKNITPYTKNICGQTVASGEEVYVPSDTKIHSRIWAKVWRNAPDSLLPKELLESKAEKSVENKSGKKLTTDKHKTLKFDNSGYSAIAANVISNTITDNVVKIPSVANLGQKTNGIKDTSTTQLTTDLTTTAKTTDLTTTEEANKHSKKKN